MPPVPVPIKIDDITPERIEKFWSKVWKTDNCWIWLGRVSPYGYATVNFGTTDYRCNRLAYYFSHNVDPYPYLVLHTCDNPICVNPEHLKLGTPADNMKDRSIKGRAPTILQGNRGGSILTDEEVIQIRSYLKQGYSQRKIAEYYGVSHGTIYRIGKGVHFKHLL